MTPSGRIRENAGERNKESRYVSQKSRRCWRQRCALLLIGLVPGIALGQSAQSASLVGKVTDESGGAMPGVTITVKSPQLQVPQLNAVTGVDGDYRVLELPRGTYSISFELSGFQTQLRSDVNLTVGLAGKVDVVMKIGAL